MAQSANMVGLTASEAVGTITGVHEVRSEFFTTIYDTDIDQVFFNQKEFGSTVRYYHSALGVWEEYKDLFDNPHTSMKLGSPTEFNSIKPQVQLQESKLKDRILKQDKIIKRGVVHQIEDFISDGVGISTVYMRLA